MTSQEFKYWFEGVVFGIGDRPTKEQWKIIKDKMAEVVEQKESSPFDGAL